MAIREGRWDCPSCGSTGIFGRHVECLGCGKPRPGGVRFYLSDDAPVVVDPERLAEARAGADWVCEHCAATNRATHPDCEGCGAPRGSSAEQPVIEYGAGEVPRSGHEPRPVAARAPVPPVVKRTGCGCLSVFALFFVLTLVGGVVSAILDPPDGLTPGVVAAKSWVRTVALEQRKVVREEGWELPDSATQVRTRERIQRYDSVVDRYEPVTREVAFTEQVPDGSVTRTREVSERVQTGTETYVCGRRDMGNGYFEDIECSRPEYETVTRTESYEEPRFRTETRYEDVTSNEPVYRKIPVRATHYTYRVPRWLLTRTLKEEGAANEPVWPQFELKRQERVKARTQRYEVVFREAASGKLHAMALLQGVWEGYRPGQRVALRVGAEGSEPAILPADSLRACRRWHAGKGDPPPDSLGCSPPPAPPR
jgi:hypothetical protein